jgi:hypothetical protein
LSANSDKTLYDSTWIPEGDYMIDIEDNYFYKVNEQDKVHPDKNAGLAQKQIKIASIIANKNSKEKKEKLGNKNAVELGKK